MIQINGIWESVNDVDDLYRIAFENIGQEFACKLKYICDKPNKDLEEQIRSLECEIEELELITVDYDDIEQRLDYLDGQIKKLHDHIANNDDNSDFIKGMKSALAIIES